MSVTDPTTSVRAIHRYPVKSMAGESLPESRVLATHGVEGDRAWALLDVETGRVASGKHPRRWGSLLEYTAAFLEPPSGRGHDAPVSITLPDGTRLRTDRDDVGRQLSVSLGRQVRLVAEPPAQATYDEYSPERDEDRGEPLAVGAGTGTFFDFAPIHFVTTGTLARLKQLRPSSVFDAARFRPNLVLDTGPDYGFLENDWLGRVLAIGEDVRLCVTFPCPRCVMTTLPQGDLPHDPGVLRTAVDHNRQLFALLAKKLPTVGAYATVVRGGRVRVGDPVRVEGRAPLQRAGAFATAIKRAVRRR